MINIPDGRGVFFGALAAVVGAKDVEGRGSDSGFMGTLCLTETEIAAFHSACRG